MYLYNSFTTIVYGFAVQTCDCTSRVLSSVVFNLVKNIPVFCLPVTHGCIGEQINSSDYAEKELNPRLHVLKQESTVVQL